ncbi:class I SAM-dependent methyltransferase [Rugosimonospora africana]|uniref:Putative methyltransferase n=1 Tax=Rugosimonospora africana TaxID=556532 RepID=A0A8J3QYD4_9ACTN|nr:class I SAM-dependent methyltransferase [Rugosimonospora africana]GIH18050.1 putative methyltransferase [Rugosimonospora africana]
MTDPSAQARSFGTAADRYDRYRPGYPSDAVVWALGERPLRVADLGAGTGILSRLLGRLGHQVVAVEPDDAMRAQLERASPGVTALAGTAEGIPLPDGSVDAVVAGQAYHWFDPGRAHPEIARVLRPGGVFATIRNDADPATPWTVRFADIIDGPQAEPAEPDFGDRFGPVRGARFSNEVWLTPDDLVAVATTRSPYLVGTERERVDLVDAVRRLAGQAGLSGRFAMPYLTRVQAATRS